MNKCPTCGEPTKFFLGVTTGDGERVEITMTGFDSREAAEAAARKALKR